MYTVNAWVMMTMMIDDDDGRCHTARIIPEAKYWQPEMDLPRISI